MYPITAEKIRNPNLQTDAADIKTGVTGMVRKKNTPKTSSMVKLNTILCRSMSQLFWQKWRQKQGILGYFMINYCMDLIECQHQLSYSRCCTKLATVDEEKYILLRPIKSSKWSLRVLFLEKNSNFWLVHSVFFVTQKSEPNSLKADLIWTNYMVAKHISLEVPSAVRSIESNIWKDDFITAPNSSLLGQKGSVDIWL